MSRGGGDGESWVGMFSPSPLRPDSPLISPPRRRLPLDSPLSTPLGDRRNLRLHSLDSPLSTPMADGPRRSLRLHSLDSLLVLPLQRPRSLHLETFTAPAPSGRRTHRRSKPALGMYDLFLDENTNNSRIPIGLKLQTIAIKVATHE